MEKVICPNCGGVGILESSTKIYNGRDHGLMYICENYPQCDSYVGTHKGSDRPLGIMANAEHRMLKRLCHEKFDLFWKSGAMRRQQAYQKLQKIMNLPKYQAHMGMFTVDQCKELLAKLESNEELNSIYTAERERHSDDDMRVPFD